MRKFILNENILTEAKADEQRLIDFAGEELAKEFLAIRKNLKSPENDIYYWIKKTPEELANKINEINAKEYDIEDRPIPKDNGNYDIVYNDNNWTVYHPKDYIASIYCAKGARWCTAGGYEIPDGKIKVSQAKHYFNQYKNEGFQLYYYINKQNQKDCFALALSSTGNYSVFNYDDDNITSSVQEYNLPNVPGLPQLHFDIPDIYIYDGTDISNNIREYIKNVKIKDGMTSIGNSAFAYCNSLTSIAIPDSVMHIGGYAFYECSSLTSVTIPNSVTSIGDEAFYDCSNLTNITIPDSVTSIGSDAFIDCDNLTSIVIPNSLTSINISAFFGCSNLTDVYYAGSEKDWNKIDIKAGNDTLLNANIHFNSRG